MLLFHKEKLKKILPLLLILTAGVVFFVPRAPAYAGLAEWIGGFFISIIALNLFLISTVTTFIMQIGGKLLAFVMTTTFNEGLFYDAPFVRIAWAFCRDFANLFFILWLVIIAIATIVDYKGYAAKRLLVKVILVAVVVNFSLVICGFILDIAQGLMGFLTQAVIVIEGKPYSLAEGLVYSFRQSEMFGARVPSLGSFFGNFDAAVNTVMHNGLVVAFGGVAAYVFILLAVMLLVRVVALWLLMIFAPLAWAIGVMPFGSKASKQWWGMFMNYAFQGLIVAFFIYMAAMAVWAIQESEWSRRNFQQANLMSGSSFGTQISFLENFQSILSFLTVMILLLAAKNAVKTSGQHSGMVVGAVGGFIMGKIGRKGIGGKISGKIKRKSKDFVSGQTTRAKGWIGREFQGRRIPIAGKVFTRWTVDDRKRREATTRSYADYANLTDEELMNVANRASRQRMNDAEKAQIAKIMSDRNLVYRIQDNNQLRSLYESLTRLGKEEDVRKFESKRPDAISPHTLRLHERVARVARGELETGYLGPISAEETARVEERRREAIERAVKTGEFKNWTREFVDNMPNELMAEFANNRDAAKALGKASEDWATSLKNTVLEKIQASFSTTLEEGSTETENNLAARRLHAKVSGNYHAAFFRDQNGNVIEDREYLQNPALTNALREQISKINREKEWEAVNDSPENLALIAQHMETSQVGNGGRYLNSANKDIIFEEVRRAREDAQLTNEQRQERDRVYRRMLENDLWPGYREDYQPPEQPQLTDPQRPQPPDDGTPPDGEQGRGPDNGGGGQGPVIPGGRGPVVNEQEQEEQRREPREDTQARQEPVGRQEDEPAADRIEQRTEYRTEPRVEAVPEEQGPVLPENQPPRTEQEITPQIITPGSRGNVRFSSGPGWTPQQRREIEETRQAKYRESLERRQQKSANTETDKPVKEEKLGQKTPKEVKDEQIEKGISLSNAAINQAKTGNVAEAINFANQIDAYSKQGETLWEIASILIDKGDFDNAFKAARQIKDFNMRENAISEVIRREKENQSQ